MFPWNSRVKFRTARLPSGLAHGVVWNEDRSNGLFVQDVTPESVYRAVYDAFPVTLLPEWAGWLTKRLRQQGWLVDLDVYLVANDASLPKPLRSRQVFGWAAVRAVLKESVAAICRHPVVRDHLARPGAEGVAKLARPAGGDGLDHLPVRRRDTGAVLLQIVLSVTDENFSERRHCRPPSGP